MAIWAITGGIGCGKSTAISAFEALGVTCFSADKDARDVLCEQTVLSAVRDAFPEAFNDALEIDREKLGHLIFSNPTKREVLGMIMHPAIRKRIAVRIARNHEQSPLNLEIYEIPLLFEGGLETWFDGTICITCNPEVQKQRLVHRYQIRYGTSLSDEDVDNILNSQLSVAEKAAKADVVIDNSRLPESLILEVNAFYNRFKTDVNP